MRSRQALFQRVSASLIIPVTFLPLAAILLALGTQLGIAPLEAAGRSLLQVWLPLIFGIGISIGFTEGDGMGVLSTVAGYLTMVAVAEKVAGDPSLHLGVLGGIVAGAVCAWFFNKVKDTSLPEYLALFSGKRLGPLVGALAGLVLGFLFGAAWPPIQRSIIALGEWMYQSGGVGIFAYGATLRVLIPTGLHHILMQLVDYQIGGWMDPESGKMVAGEYVRFLAGDPSAGRILSGFFLTLGFGPLGAALAMTHEAKPSQRRKVGGLMTTAALTAMLLGVTEPIEFAFIFASPLLFALHIILAGLGSLVAWALNIHLGGYALPMILINWRLQQNGWLLIPLGLVFTAVYYVSFRAVIRWRRPPILGQVEEGAPGVSGDSGRSGPGTERGEAGALLAALGGAGNVVTLDACMTRLRLVVRDPGAVDDARLRQLGAAAVLRPGAGEVQVVVGARAGELAARVKAVGAGEAPAPPPAPLVTLLSPLGGTIVPLDQVPDPVFAGRLAGDGVAILPTSGQILAPATGRVVLVFPGGHALGLATPDGLELLIHIGIDTVALQGQGFHIAVKEGDQVTAGDTLGHFDPATIEAAGKSLISPVLITNPDAATQISRIADGTVRAGEPLLLVRRPAQP
ncbi:MAG: system N-acetylglucosamine-specific enzyme component [Symbiobacteriaceae bacterium]|jgi:glucose-specific phosphotransferase system IIA component|nr:system N-acetylglucosamine-specific enzyme component [Symbiobacteriaceae bacterium]